MELAHAIDISEQNESPRVFILAGELPDTFVILGGVSAYWLNVDGRKTGELKLFRAEGDEEYWTSSFVERSRDLIFVYEAGVLILDSKLNVTFHKKKFYNDVLVSVADDGINFVRDHDDAWFMKI